MEERTERKITVRQVTDVQASWTEEGRGKSGEFTLQLILDNGAEEYVLQPTAEDAGVLMDFLSKSATIHFDTERKVVVFGNIPLN